MSTFGVYVKKIRAITPHPKADRLEFAHIDGYRSIVRKGQYAPGDLVAYLPEAAVLPEALLRHLDLWDEAAHRGKLSGPQGNRISAIRLRDELSQGICYPVADFKEGDEISGLLGVTKYQPEVPDCLKGDVVFVGHDAVLHFDVENVKSYPDALQDGEEVIFTEKLHGTCTIVGILPYAMAFPEGFGERNNLVIFSKDLGAKGFVFANTPKNQAENVYVRATRPLIERIDAQQREADSDQELTLPFFILGETYGRESGQDLHYGTQLDFRVFAAAYGSRTSVTHGYLDWDSVDGPLKARLGYATVPLLYRGPYSEAVRQQHTAGKTTVAHATEGAAASLHIREGIVMVPVSERRDPRFGRVCLKSVSDAYLSRKGGTEHT